LHAKYCKIRVMDVEGGAGGRGEELGADCVAQKHTDTSLKGVGKVGCHREWLLECGKKNGKKAIVWPATASIVAGMN
jgi:hypothetical protein